MPTRRTPAARVRRHLVWPLLALLACFGLAACQQPAGERVPAAPAEAATRPVDAVYLLRDRLLARDGAGFARLAVPPDLHAQLGQAWREGRSRWPLDELPLDARLPAMLAALQAPNAETALMASFNRQFAHADHDIDQAVRTLVVFGTEYVARDPTLGPDERAQTLQAIEALGRWAIQAPLDDPARAHRFFIALTAAARRTGLDGQAGWPALAALGMTQSLNRLSPFFATLLAQLRQQYGLDLDATLRGLDVRLVEQTGDQARLHLHYLLAGTPVDAELRAVRLDGHWYLADYVERAQRSLAGPAQ
jgi:hypothetical protein